MKAYTRSALLILRRLCVSSDMIMIINVASAHSASYWILRTGQARCYTLRSLCVSLISIAWYLPAGVTGWAAYAPVQLARSLTALRSTATTV